MEFISHKYFSLMIEVLIMALGEDNDVGGKNWKINLGLLLDFFHKSKSIGVLFLVSPKTRAIKPCFSVSSLSIICITAGIGFDRIVHSGDQSKIHSP